MSTKIISQPLTNTVNPVIYSVTLGTTPYHIENTVISGFIYNPNNSAADVIITQSTNGPVTITLQPQEVFNFENVQFTSLTAPTLPLTLIFAESTKEFFRITSQIQSVEISSLPAVQISSPLDSNGYIEVDLKTPIPSGSNAIGTVGVTSYGNPTRVTKSPSYLSVSLTTANTAQQIATSSTIARKVFITNTSTTDTIYVGASTPSIPIGPSDTFILDMNGDIDQTDLSTWYFVAPTAGDTIKVTYL
ncbi:MAG: hypothetical protein QXV17_08275 [Candidatus Micrarchaeaceae archaeon]